LKQLRSGKIKILTTSVFLFKQSYVLTLLKFHDYRGYAGRVAGGVFRPGEEVTILPSLRKSKIKSIDVLGKTLSETVAGDSVAISLEDEIDISRGDMLVSSQMTCP
jgi:sulfate adenylyltransferase subunit 1 (EFTu-like GTPase family)